MGKNVEVLFALHNMPFAQADIVPISEHLYQSRIISQGPLKTHRCDAALCVEHKHGSHFPTRKCGPPRAGINQIAG